MDASTLLKVDSFFLSRGFARKVQGNKLCFNFHWFFPHIRLYHDNDMSYENPIWLLGIQIHCVGLEGTELFQAACSFLHTSRSLKTRADLIFSAILDHRVVFFLGGGSHQIICFYGLALFGTYCMCLKEPLSRCISRNERRQFLRLKKMRWSQKFF